jgi:tetratricopeptide (TPR) repeat protein
MRPGVRRALFWSITVLLPFALLAGVEILFRAAGLFAPEPLFVDVQESRGTVLKFNPWVTRRYFDSTAAALPNLAPETFTREKSPSTFRILCLGESTTAGFPFESQVPFPAQLREILAHAQPRRRIEVLNAGMSAISSYVVLDLLPELLRETKPDLVVVYLGHNEFYGVFGSGSTLFPGKKRALVTLALRLQHFHVVQMLKRLVEGLRSHPATVAENRTLMQNVVGDQEIALGSREYRNTMEAFRINLESIAGLCRDRGVPVVMGNLVSNERDQPPFHSLALPAGEGERSRHVGSVLGTGDSLLVAGDVGGAKARFLEAWRADSNNADAWYGVARATLAEGDSSGALQWFQCARDRDAMRFRATGEASEIIRAAAGATGARFADVAEVFRAASPGGIIGRELMCDHLHPNPRGYFLMAAAFYRGIVSTGLLPPPDSAYHLPESPYGVTDLDWEIGLLKVFPMLHEWPFKAGPIKRGEYHPYGDTAATRIAVQYHRAKFAWVRAHDMLGHAYLERGDLERARREYAAIAVFQPDDPWPHQQIARLYEAEGNWKLRSAALQEALVRSPVKGMIAYQLAMSEWKQGHLGNAIRGMEFASGAPELKREERQNARFYLAGFLSDDGRREDAIRTLRSILADDPSFAPAQKFLSRLERNIR